VVIALRALASVNDEKPKLAIPYPPMHLKSLLRGAHAYLSPTAAVAGLSSADAASRPANVPHSIAEIVAHMAFWQEWFLDRCDGMSVPSPAAAALGWPKVDNQDWEAVLRRFDRGFNRALAVANDTARLTQPLTPAIEVDFLASYTTGDALTPPRAAQCASCRSGDYGATDPGIVAAAGWELDVVGDGAGTDVVPTIQLGPDRVRIRRLRIQQKQETFAGGTDLVPNG
jgi:DinB superfamily